MSVNASTRSLGRRVKRIEISKVRPETSAFVLFHKYQLSKYSLTGECFDRQLSGISGLKKLHFLLFYTFNANSQGHPMDLFLKISVLYANFCRLGDVEEIIVLRRKVLLGKR